ncbi:hypothetical protein KUTeg_009593 [Tegillarca granosa]|uniref:Mannosylglycerate hydrolase MGH1-like glycoside hydrolase domain-containing protein n=1 Tax=Tegillarca granosa TaxID=220873 RepID=A0ABQ9F7H2_TEGGR|nr:hypothetical protein KUTeg_009593 [Tegillarca granosa]
MASVERKRLREDKLRVKNWKRWGPYLAERQWGTVREDYSEDGNCWNHLTHEQSRSRAYRWGEDGLLVALWNTQDPILKERLYGLTGHEGNHGEDCKELYYYLDSTPTHSYMKALYKYPQSPFPYANLLEENKKRWVNEPEYELQDTGIFDENRYFDVSAEYCKNTPNDILVRYIITNRGPEKASVHVLPTIWFRNVWSWGTNRYCYIEPKPKLFQVSVGKVVCEHATLGIDQGKLRQNSFNADNDEDNNVPNVGPFYWEVDVDPQGVQPDLLFTNNDTNNEHLYGTPNKTRYVKDAFHNYVIQGDITAVNPQREGTKCAAHYILHLEPGQKAEIRTRLYYVREMPQKTFGKAFFDNVFSTRKQEADRFYSEVIPNKSRNEIEVVRQAYAGLMWTKQFYYYVIEEWLQGDSTQPPPPACRYWGRNSDWRHLFNRDVISVPDKWEYPWYASWDLAFHMIPMATLDIQFAKEQLILFLREWYMHPNGQIPAYEFCFEDVNPPVHAYSVLKVYKSSGPKGKRDILFLARCFHKLILNFTWWINRKDLEGKNIFSGGFLGLDNIGPLPTGGFLAQADATAWMGFFCSIMLEMSLILARRDHIYEDMASKFFEHFVAIVDAINKKDGIGLWDDEEGFYYDHVRNNQQTYPLKILSMVGLVPLFSSLVLKEYDLKKYPDFYKRTKWFLEHRKDLAKSISFMSQGEDKKAYLLAIVSKEKLVRVLKHILNEEEFLSRYGVRSLSKHHREQPFTLHGNNSYSVRYEPGESESKLFGVNYLLIENLYRYDYFYGDSLKVECPTGSGHYMRLRDVARFLSDRLTDIFLPDFKGYRPCHGHNKKYAKDPFFKRLILFYEYFNGDTGKGCGASHQTGWTALVATLFKHLFEQKQEYESMSSDAGSEGEISVDM